MTCAIGTSLFQFYPRRFAQSKKEKKAENVYLKDAMWNKRQIKMRERES